MANQDRHSYVQFYPSDWIAGLAFMPPMAEWLYLQVCLYNWDKRAAMPATEAPLRLSRSPSWQADLEALIGAGKVIRTQAGGLFVERAMVEAERAYDLWERKSKGGRVSKNKRENQRNAQQSLSTPPGTLGSNENESENESEIDPNGSSAGDLVFSIPATVWRDFKEHRIKLKAPMTKRAEAMILKELEELHGLGHDPTEVINQSIVKGWKGVFELKGKTNGDRFGRDGRNGLFDACAE